MTVDDFDPEIECDGVSIPPWSYSFDRDNTGLGAEAYVLEVVDGDGNPVVGVTGAFPFVDASSSALELPWDEPPASNPLTLRFVSIAGNGLAEQVVLHREQ